MATIYDVCREAGVSMATVSRVINQSERVRPATRQKVLAVMQELGYKPSQIAQSLASKFTNSIGIQVSKLSGPFYGPMMSGIDDELHLSNKQALITSGHSDEKREKEGIEALISRQCDALILYVEAVSDNYLINLSKRKVPFVLLNRYIDEIADQCIVLNDKHGGYIATHHLTQSGHKDIAYVSGPKAKNDSASRLSGHRLALNEANIEFKSELYYEGDFTKQSGEEAIRYFLDNGISFSALVCANDEMAAGALSVIREAGLNIPQQVSIIGYDDLSITDYLYPRLTTVNYPIEEMASMAVKWVLKNVYNQDIQINNIFTPTLVERDSCSVRKLH